MRVARICIWRSGRDHTPSCTTRRRNETVTFRDESVTLGRSKGSGLSPRASNLDDFAHASDTGMRPPWQLRAACRGKSTELWFATANIEATDAAKAVCVGCPVRQDCLSYALVDLALEGIWAGTDAAERRRLRRVSA